MQHTVVAKWFVPKIVVTVNLFAVPVVIFHCNDVHVLTTGFHGKGSGIRTKSYRGVSSSCKNPGNVTTLYSL